MSLGYENDPITMQHSGAGLGGGDMNTCLCKFQVAPESHVLLGLFVGLPVDSLVIPCLCLLWNTVHPPPSVVMSQ